jgi:serine/threonine-protein kinase
MLHCSRSDYLSLTKRAVRRRDSRDSRAELSGSVTLGLPPDLVEKAGRRLGLAALVYAVTYTLAYASGRVTGNWSEFWGSNAFPQTPDYIAAGFVLMSIGIFYFARSGLVTGQRLLDLGLVYEVVGAAGIDVHLAWGMWPTDVVIAGLSWVAVWIVFFPLVVPSTPGKTAVAAVAAASTTVVLYYIGVARGAEPIATGHVIQTFVGNYICAGIAIVGSRVVYSMGADITKARRMGSYRLVEKLGEGGMGEVWKAEHRMLARPAAIKLIRGGSSGSGGSDHADRDTHRFEREVQATAQLRSPHTVEVYDYGLTEDRNFYYVMELLDGLSLEELVKQHGPVPPERAVHILRQVCHSLAEAHQQGMVHRDIKPANVFLARYGQDVDFVKVLDFGLVKRAGEQARRDVKLTDVGTFAGTPAYGSPEGAAGEAEEVDPRSDLYSLGCVAYWLMTGRTVFRADSPLLMLVQHIHNEPEPPSRHSEFGIPPDLERLVLECLRKDKTDRPPSAEILAARLAVIEQERPWSRDRAQQWWDRHRPVRAAQPEEPSPEEVPQVVKV